MSVVEGVSNVGSIVAISVMLGVDGASFVVVLPETSESCSMLECRVRGFFCCGGGGRDELEDPVPVELEDRE